MAITKTVVVSSGFTPTPNELLPLNCIQVISDDTETGIQELIASVTSEFHKIYCIQIISTVNAAIIQFYSNTTEISRLKLNQGEDIFLKYYPLYLRTASGEAFQFSKDDGSCDLAMNIWYSTGTRT